jgi:hypothetical protein
MVGTILSAISGKPHQAADLFLTPQISQLNLIR